MKESFDREIRERIKEEPVPVPQQVHRQIEQTLESLPEKKERRRIVMMPRGLAVAAAILLLMLVLLPNVSVAYAQAVEKIPVIGDLVQIFTVRNYFYSDGHHELDAEIPEVNDSDHAQISDLINKNVDELTNAVIQKFYQELEITGGTGYGSIYIDYETVTNTEEWFTLKLTVSELAASSNTYLRFYHIDRVNGTYVTFGDLFRTEDFQAIEELGKEQMRLERESDEDAVYWFEKTELGQSIPALEEEQNFYFNGNGDLVVVYNQYEVGPGSMGCPEITISSDLYEQYLRYGSEK